MGVERRNEPGALGQQLDVVCRILQGAALDANSGKVLWKSPQMTSGIIGVPSSWKVNGKQYVGIWSGWGGASPIWGGEMTEDPKFKAIPTGGHLYVFSLDGAGNATAQR